MTLHLGFDARDAVDPDTGGWGRYARYLLKALRKREAAGDLRITTYEAAPAGVPELVFEQLLLPRLARRDGIDVLHAPNCFLPARRPCAGVVTVHDLAFERYPDDFARLTGWKYRRFTRSAVASAERIIVPSESTRSELLALYGTDPGRVHVVPEASALMVEDQTPLPAGPVTGGRPPTALARSGGVIPPVPPTGGRPSPPAIDPGKPYILCVSAIREKKNIARLVEAYGLARQAGLTQKLVIAGPGDPAGHAAEGVQFLGPADDAMLDALYRGADLLVYPSLYEGFGLVTLEAMERGCPVLLARATSLPEVGGDAAGYFDPGDIDDIARVLSRVAGDAELRSRMREQGLARAAQFSWDRAAEATLEIYREALGDRRRT